MPQIKTRPANNSQPRRGASPVPSASVESVARIGSYSTDITAGRWVSSKGLDAIFGIDAAYDRSVEGWPLREALDALTQRS